MDELRYDDASEAKASLASAAASMVDAALDHARGLAKKDGDGVDAGAVADAFARRRGAEVAAVTDVLRKFEANQFQFEHGGPNVEGACALYRQVARMNHSCAPSVVLEPSRLPQRPGERFAGDGAVSARTCCAVNAGEALTISYGAKDLVNWDVDDRRAYLRDKNGFFCMCLRCQLEAGNQTKPS